MADPMTPPLQVRPLATPDEAEWCATLMASSEPWLTLRRTFDASLRLIQDPTRVVYLAESGPERAGFLILSLAGPLPGYIQTICIAPDSRGKGLGSQLLAFAEARIFQMSPNVFLCVSSFNPKARRLYERSGYTLVGELRDFLVPGHSELLFRKSVGAWSEFVLPKEKPRNG
jgi:ribosomal protein S18 acetylase RimI-like enzyme